MKKITSIIIITIILTISLVSCQNGKKAEIPDGAVSVLSNYPNMSYITPGAYDVSKFEDGAWAKNGYSTYVTSVDGKLAVMPNHVQGSSGAPYVSQNTSYTFENVKGDADGVYLDGAMIIAEKCVGMIHSYSKDKLLVFTTADDKGSVCLFERKEDGTSLMLSNQTISIDGNIDLIYYDWKNMNSDAPEEVYVITSKGIVILKTDSFLNTNASISSIEAVSVKTPDWWQYVRPTSATKVSDGTVFVGEREGVIGIESDGTVTYYPIDYSKAMGK